MSALSDTDTARAIYGAGIDILVDLKGYTQGARTGVMMLRPAPVQVNFLGYPGTLGGGICDYIITDGFVTPMTAASDYSESFAYMPHSYQPHGRRGVIGRKPARSEAGLPESGFVFCCFNQAYKFTPPVFDLWCRLLEAVPDSVLWLLSAARAEGNLRQEALRRGISMDRLVFAPDMAQSDHLGRLQLADLVLDTIPYGAHTTASDALFAGVPIVDPRRRHFSLARRGRPFARRRPAGIDRSKRRRLFRDRFGTGNGAGPAGNVESQASPRSPDDAAL